jgi:hypothetical protein
MTDIRSDKEGCGPVMKARASLFGTADAAKCAGSVARADGAGESGNECKSPLFD